MASERSATAGKDRRRAVLVRPWFAVAWVGIVASCAAGPRPATPEVAAEERWTGGDGPNRVPLVLTFDDGVADSQVVPVEVDGTFAWLAVDTGSPITFLFHAEGDTDLVEDAGEVRIGNARVRVPGYGDEGIGVEVFAGKPILGVLGLDFFVPRGEIDYPGRRVVAYGTALVPDAADLPGLPLRVREGRARVPVRLDGQELDLLLDTGAHDTLWLGVEGQPGDEEAAVATADGAVASVHVGTARIELPGDPPRRVTVLRARDIPYLSPWLVEEEGANGLLGLTSIGFRRVVLDGDRLRLGPLREGSGGRR